MNKRKTIRILLLNANNDLLLMRVVDPTTTALDKKSRGAFWCTIGGKIEANESIQDAMYRELFEETGLLPQDVELGPIVWYGTHRMIISGIETELEETFIVVFAINTIISTENFTENEKSGVTHLEWLSLEQILNHKEIIFPVIFKDHLSDIVNGKFPDKPIEVDLSLLPV